MLERIGDTAALERAVRVGARRRYEAIFLRAQRYWRTYDIGGIGRRMRVANKLVTIGRVAFGSLEHLDQHLREQLCAMQHSFRPVERGQRLLTISLLRLIEARKRGDEKKGGRDDGLTKTAEPDC